MSFIVVTHSVIGVVIVVFAAVVGFWGLASAKSIAADTKPRASRVFGHLLQLVHTLVFAQMLIGMLMYIEGNRPHDNLHVSVYGPFMLAAIVASYAYRTKDATTNVRVFAITTLIIFALGLRSLWTGW